MLFEFLLLTLTFVCFGCMYSKKQARNLKYYSCDDGHREKCLKEIEKLACLPYSNPSEILITFNDSKIVYVDSESTFEYALPIIESSSYIGVDIEEYRFSSYLGFICLIQIYASGSVYLIDTLKIRSLIPRLSKMFSDPRVIKVFHGCPNDTKWLQRDFGIITVNVFDTQIAAQTLKFKKLGITELWDKFCGHVMSVQHKKRMQGSRWDIRPLESEQIKYAALDSYYLVYLMGKLIEKMNPEQIMAMRKLTCEICMKKFDNSINSEKCIKNLRKHIKQPLESHTLFWFIELTKIRDKYAKARNEYNKSIIDDLTLAKISLAKPKNNEELLTYGKGKFISILADEIQIISKSCQETKLELVFGGKQNSRMQKKQERYGKFLEKYTMSKKVYENCQIQAPDGEILCFTDMRKAKWYVERKLADVITESPFIIRLNFEPNGRGFSDVEADQIYYSKEKKNECVSCGSTTSYLKYHVVPLLYRQYFPKDHKSHRSHDVVLLCARCHEIANKHSDKLKYQISQEYGIPLHSFSDIHKSKETLRNMRKIALSILKNSKSLPANRMDALRSQVEEFIEQNTQYAEFFEGKNLDQLIEELSKEEFSKKLLNVYGNVNWKKELSNNHGKLVVEQLKDLKAFIRVLGC